MIAATSAWPRSQSPTTVSTLRPRATIRVTTAIAAETNLRRSGQSAQICAAAVSRLIALLMHLASVASLPNTLITPLASLASPTIAMPTPLATTVNSPIKFLGSAANQGARQMMATRGRDK